MKAIELQGISKQYGDSEILTDISFEVEVGETVGIIGPNGAGKSTLLKILSGIVRPSSGRAVLNGSVSSILEVGMGFHPDLSGYENVFFAGQMMGHSKAQIQERMEDIIDFSELHDHMDKMVKFYSSGMYLRLAFSVYTVLESDILLIDEVLSVGDASFKRKSFDKMIEYKNKNKTILLVSHNLNDVENFCDRVIYIDKVLKKDSANIRSVVFDYMRDHPSEPKILDASWMMVDSDGSIGATSGKTQTISIETKYFKITSLKLLNSERVQCSTFEFDDEIYLELGFFNKLQDSDLYFIWKLFDMNDNLLLATSPMFRGAMSDGNKRKTGDYLETTKLPARLLNNGQYYFTLVSSINKSPGGTYHRLVHFDMIHSKWMMDEEWPRITAPILHYFPWNSDELNSPNQ